MAPVVIDVGGAEDRRDVVHRSVQALAEGQLVALPTETVYGLAASARSPSAVARLIEIKGRSAQTPLTLAVKSADEALDYVPEISILGRRLARRCWPGPVTLVLGDNHPDSLVQQLPESVRTAVIPGQTLGLRVPAHQLVLEVLRLLVGPLVLTSANLSGQPDAITAVQVVESFGEEVPLVLDDGRSRFAQPSSVVQVEENRLQILRSGVVDGAALKRLSSLLILMVCTGNTCRSPMAELLLRKRIADKLGCRMDELDEVGVNVMSAGVSAVLGGHPSQGAVSVMSERGLDLSHHESQPLSDRLVRHADVIFTMAQSHRSEMLARWPEASERTELLCTDCADVSDPIGGPTYVYRACAEQIDVHVEARLNELDVGKLIGEMDN